MVSFVRSSIWAIAKTNVGLVPNSYSRFVLILMPRPVSSLISGLVTDKGFIFINFSAEEPESFESYFGTLPEEWQHLPKDDYEYAYSWSMMRVLLNNCFLF